MTINGNTNDYRYEFPIILKNVEHVEVVSAIIPKSSYRINETNDVIPLEVGGMYATLTMTHGVYDTISNIQLEINKQIALAIASPGDYFEDPPSFPVGSKITLLLDSMTRKIFIQSWRNIGVNKVKLLWKSKNNTCARAFGFIEDASVGLPPPTSYTTDFVETSILFQTAMFTGTVQVNNLPSSYYTGLDMFATTPITASQWYYAFAEDRVNITHQIFIDIEVDEFSYWDGTKILQQVHIPEDQSIVNYQRQYPSYRRLREDKINLDHLTISFTSIVEPGLKKPYEFNGIDYSVQLEIITRDLELNNE